MFQKIINIVTASFLLFLISLQTFAQNYPSVFDPATLNGKNGFKVAGIINGSNLPSDACFIGDINNDGLEDICLGTEYYSKPNNNADSIYLGGTAYIIFGSKKPFPATFDLKTLNGTNGFKVEGIVEDERRGKFVSGLGDVNGDGIDDLALGTEKDKVMVVYGSVKSFSAAININSINGTNGFIISQSGIYEVRPAGDVNGDGLNDILLGHPVWDGDTWVIFGQKGNFPTTITASWLDGTKGFRLSASDNVNISAFFVSTAGDINNDGFADIIVGNWWNNWDATAPSRTNVLFGKKEPFNALIDIKTLNGTNGFAIDNNAATNAFLLWVGSVGDINGDGIDDCFSLNNILFGSKKPFTSPFNSNSLNGSNGFVIKGGSAPMASAGDLNQDGITDFIVTAFNEDWIIYGSKTGFNALFDPATLNGTNGFKIKNLAQSNVGRVISGAGDVNGDGLSDFLIGNAGDGKAGAAYIVFGGDHYAQPLQTGYPKAMNNSYSGFTLQVNATEAGTIHYSVYPTWGVGNTKTAILNGTGALQYGSLNATAGNDVNKIISGLDAGTAYTVSLYVEDAAGNTSEIYNLFDVRTLTDTESPAITCPKDQQLACNSLLPDYATLAVVKDNIDATLTVSQSPVKGSSISAGMTVTLNVSDKAGNKNSCSFIVNIIRTITCPGNQNLIIGAPLPDYTGKAITSGYCSPVITQVPAAGAAVKSGMTVTLKATDSDNTSKSCSFIVNTSTTPVQTPDDTPDAIIFPNPSSDLITIKGIHYHTFEIIDNLGNVSIAGTQQNEIHIGTLAIGLYTILIYNEDHQIMVRKKLIKN